MSEREGPNYDLAFDDDDEFEQDDFTHFDNLRLVSAMKSLGFAVNDDALAHFKVLIAAFSIFDERNKRHQSIWKDSGSRGIIVDLRKKVERLWNEFMNSSTPPEDLDSALDGINYFAFFIQARQAEIAGKPMGHWNWGIQE